MGNPSLLVALEYLQLLIVERPAKFPLAALRWHGRFELETRTLTLAESQLALSALVAMREEAADSADPPFAYEEDLEQVDDVATELGMGGDERSAWFAARRAGAVAGVERDRPKIEAVPTSSSYAGT